MKHLPLCVLALVPAMAVAHGQVAQDWPFFGGQPANDHYSALQQINRNNVSQLRVAWTFDSGEKGGMETNPVIVGQVLYAFTPTQKVIALDASIGRLLWKFDAGINGTQPARGVAYWTDGRESRVFAGIMNYLYSLDAKTGKPIPGFGEDGRIDLRKGLRGDYAAQSFVLTSPGAVYKDLIIVGGRDPETPPAPPGDIRAFDVHTGALRWRFHTIPHPEEPGYRTWPANAWTTAGAANDWGGMTLDAARGIVYAPTGSAVPDFYGGARIGDDLYADCLLALDAGTGKLIWHFQGVHHDIWDRDFPAAPALVTLHRNGETIDAVAQTTKQGWLFVFDRTNGKPLFPIEERSVPPSDVPGETASSTQPIPLKPEPYDSRQVLTEDLLTNRTPEAHAWALQQFKTFYSKGPFVPLRVDQPTVVFPGFDGGAEWGGAAVDQRTAVIYINSNDIAATGSVVKNNTSAGVGYQTYQAQCAVCHGQSRGGSPPDFPTLVNVEQRLGAERVVQTIHEGRGRMPAFPALQNGALDALLAYLRTGAEEPSKELGHGESAEPTSSLETRYLFTGYNKFYDPQGYPAVAPPWGTLAAIDLNSGDYLWKIPLGEYPELTAKGIARTGTENYGGPMVIAGGLVIIGATVFDRKIRAFDSQSGKLLWEAELPFAGLATPSTYMVDGRQYIVIAAGGGKFNTPSGGMYVAYALPK
jgi:quinoprotein glucose dehydrogenase